MGFMKHFLNRRVSSTGIQAETHPSERSSQYNPRSVATAGENHESSSSNAASASGIQPLVGSSGTNQAFTIPQSIIPGTPSGQVSSADQSSRADPALNDMDRFLSALQALSGMVLPLGLPQVAKSASQLLTLFDDKRKNDAGVRNLILDISKIILGLVTSLGESKSTVTTEQERIVADVKSYLETLQAFCEAYLKGNPVYRFIFSSAWKDKIDDVRRGVQTHLIFVNTKALLAVLDKLDSPQQPIATSHEPSPDQAFQNTEFLGNVKVKINNFSQSGLDQSLPIPRNHGSSNAFKDAKFGGEGNITISNHNQEFGHHPTS